ncbi:hypothetical protein TPHA_0C00290 [Tetrapisispora phaffii CBS 4417]|uniref:Protein HIR n=1 Tax=Tetrapisispora phaffii (strain ATCC 24235 / CBS 4417 / NBRC 1672 / NRRL Y-8282 / UCD 70-5) TaxID=1071381 RepID=G8BR10_TETPH|nr:hypothetical protein TPHA_0C00290 [Tetrapisispora phaffii CBS 4417]CCE62186.1 hypothetical protein TPHA_0C00290 [Tetrapisispora phaffii CBS 4417]
MKLLKYPIGISNTSSVNALDSIDGKLVLIRDDGNMVVWSQQKLIDAAFDRIDIGELSEDFSLDLSEIITVKNTNHVGYNNLKYITHCENSKGTKTLIVGSYYKLIYYEDWYNNCNPANKIKPKPKVLYQGKKLSSTVTDVKYDPKLNIIFILINNKNKVLLFSSKTMKKLSEITFVDAIQPITGIVDPMGQIFTVLSLDQSVRFYQIKSDGNYKLIKTLQKKVNIYPLNYKINMPPSANFYPLINYISAHSTDENATNNVKNNSTNNNSQTNAHLPTSSDSTVFLDRNDTSKVITTLVTPPFLKNTVLKFSPIIYDKLNTKKNTRTRYNLLATSGSKEGTIVVWNTKRVKPLFNALKVSDSPINDIIWADDGLTIFAVSNDNVLYNFAFQHADLGEALPASEVESLLNKNILLPELEDLVDKSAAAKIKVENNDSKNIKSENSGVLISDKTDDSSTDLATKTLSTEVSSITKSQEENKSRADLSVEQNLVESSQTMPVNKIQENSNLPKDQDAKKNVINNLSKKPQKKNDSQTVTLKNSSMDFNSPAYNVPKDLRRKPKEDANGEIIKKRQKKDLESMDFLDNGLLLSNVSFSRVRLGTPKIRASFEYSPVSNKNLVLDVKNGTGNEQKPTIITLNSKAKETSKQIFKDFIPKFVTICAAGDFFWACATEDGIIYVYSDSGKRMLPPLVLGVPCSFLEASSKYLLCVTCIGELYCWDLEQLKLSFPCTTIYPLLNPSLRYSDDILTRAENITVCCVTDKGIPLVTLSNGDGYMFDRDMETWALISDGWWAYGSQYWDMTNQTNFSSLKTNKLDKTDNSGASEIMQLINNETDSIVNYMERKTNDELIRKGRIKNLQRFARTILMKEGFENIEEIVTLSHLENRILVTLKLEESKEFSRLLVLYCLRISELGYVDRLNDVLQWLYNGGDIENSKLGGETRKTLLESVLAACSDIRQIQRITTSYASAIGIIKDIV